MRLVALLVIAICATVSAASAQGVASFRNQLTGRDSVGVVRIRIVEHGDAASVIGTLAARPAPEKVKGYRVRIFFDNSQSARANAQAILNQFAESHPEISANMSYDVPYFKVSVGDFATIEEAIILYGRIKETFRKAYVMQEEISINAFKRKPTVERSSEKILEVPTL